MGFKINDFAILDFVVTILRTPGMSIRSFTDGDDPFAGFVVTSETGVAKNIRASEIKTNYQTFNIARAVIEELQNS